MANMKISILSLKTKEEDAVKCTLCNKGIMIPSNPEAKKNHCFVCNYCGSHLNIDENVKIT